MRLQAPSVAFVAYSPAVGVDRKLEYMKRAAREEGIPFDVIHVNSTNKTRRSFGSTRLISRLSRKSRHTRLKTLMHVLQSYDAVLLRFPKTPLNYQLVFRFYGHKIVTVHNTDEISELSVKKSLKRRLLIWVVKKIGTRLLRQVAGIIGVTDEIRRVEVKKARPNTPISTVITNGIDVESIPFTRFKPYDGLELHIVFLASHFQSWQGCDRLLAGITRHHGEPIVLDIIGNSDEELHGLAKDICGGSRVIFHRTLTGETLDRVMAQATLAVGTLALHRKGMRQACALKIREYIARGIPFFYAYDDPDVPPDVAWALRLESDESPIEIHRIISFARDVSGLEALSEQMRKYASMHLEWRGKTRAMYEFALRACQHRTE